MTDRVLLTSRQAAEYLGIKLERWYWIGRQSVGSRPAPDGQFGDQPYWLPETLDAHRAEILARVGRRTASPERHRAILDGMATPGLPDTPEGRAAVAADLGVHPRTVARHLTEHAEGSCLCAALDNPPGRA